ncbi:MAG: hypothetical protein LBB84_11325 [Tannerellaceae bacterium]|jgi:hypothetical protein|nr:hypothetical protein [Tannerellaceae bacterium]
MRNFVVYSLVVVIWVTPGCGSREKEAREKLENARFLYEKNEWFAAKNEIDSLRILYSKEVKVLREALDLMRRVEWKEAERNIIYCDSVLPLRKEEVQKAVEGFVFERDTLYEETGAYIPRRQTVERNIEHSYIRSGVTETGEMYLASVYFGNRPIHHTGIKVSTKNGLFAETASIPYDGGINYRFEDGGNTSEIVNYKGENGIDAVKFICANAGERIQVHYIGGKNYTIQMGEADKKDIIATYNLANILSEIYGLTTEREKAIKKKAYIEEKLTP